MAVANPLSVPIGTAAADLVPAGCSITWKPGNGPG
jgi:hypothetical protein